MELVLDDINNNFKNKYDMFINGAIFIGPGIYWFYVIMKYGIV